MKWRLTNLRFMKKLILIPVLAVLTLNFSFAQDTTKNLTVTGPGDSLSSDRYHADVSKIALADIPEQLTKTLNSSGEYRGWQNGTIYLDKRAGIYLLEIKTGITTRVIRFDRNGKAISGNIPSYQKKE